MKNNSSSKPNSPKLVSAPAHDVLRFERRPLDAIFSPETIAVIGASPKAGSVGRTVFRNLLQNAFGGTVFPINPRRKSVLGVAAYPDLSALPEPVDLAVVVTPAPTVPGIIGDCADHGVKGVVVLSAGFKETGPEGVALEQQVLTQVRRGKMRLIGPNCLGVMRPQFGLNATFASAMALPGNVGFISQSGALLTAILDWSLKENVGFSTFASMGSMLDVGWGDLIYYLADDPQTQSIVIYMETIGDARAFLSAAREVAYHKPIIVIKPGRTKAAAQAAASHTGSLTGQDEVLDAAFSRCGVVRVNDIDELFSMAEVLSKQPRPRGQRLTVVTNAGGPGVLAADALVSNGGELTPLSKNTLTALNKFLPPQWSHNNPIDILGDAGPDRYAKTLEVAAADPQCDGLLVILTPQDMTDPTQTARDLRPYAQIPQKPLLASWMGGTDVEKGVSLLNRARIPTFGHPDMAAKIFATMWRHSDNLRLLYETPSLLESWEKNPPHQKRAQAILHRALDAGRTLLTEHESKKLLAFYGLPIVKTEKAKTPKEAVQMAKRIGFPVVLKLHSNTVTHKSDVGGVQLDLKTPEAVRAAFEKIRSNLTRKYTLKDFQGVTVQPMIAQEGFELILGSAFDPQFGPVLLFGYGGTLVEIFKDRALGLPPLNSTLARRLMEKTHIFKALGGVRGMSPVHLANLEQFLVRFSQLVVDQPRIKEIDLNPILASGKNLWALDARIVLHPPHLSPRELPRSTIRPYPAQYQSTWRNKKTKTSALIRPIRPEDEPAMVKFHETLSERSVYLRFFHFLKLNKRIAHERLARLCFIDYDREMALVAVRRGKSLSGSSLIGVARLSKHHSLPEAEFALVITDDFQNQGLGTEMLKHLVAVAKDEGLEKISAEILNENSGMQALCRKMGFSVKSSLTENTVRAELDLR